MSAVGARLDLIGNPELGAVLTSAVGRYLAHGSKVAIGYLVGDDRYRITVEPAARGWAPEHTASGAHRWSVFVEPGAILRDPCRAIVGALLGRLGMLP